MPSGVPATQGAAGAGRPPRRWPTFLVTGGSGQVGFEVARELGPFGRVVAPPSSSLDLADTASIARVVRELRPDVVVNAGAYTAVDAAESDATDDGRPARINARAPGALGEEARRLGARVVHVSTDYVFDGTARAPYAESAPTNPLQVYGRTKLAGERALAESGCEWTVVRTSWVYGARGRNFLRTMLRAGAERDELRVVADQTGSPTSSRALAVAVATIARAAAAAGDGAWVGGVFHVASAGSTTWHGFAEALLEEACALGLLARVPRVLPLTTEEFGAPAPRPRYSVLDAARVADVYGVRLPDWREQLGHVLRELRDGGMSAGAR